MKLKLNREFLIRHLFALAVFAGLGGWFSLDAFVRYPATPAPELYEIIEKAPPSPDANVEAFKAQKIATQRILALLTLLAAGGVGFHLFAISRFDFEFGEKGFDCNGRHYDYKDIERVDSAQWEKKGILTIVAGGKTVRLDSWHYQGVKEFRERIGMIISK